MEDGIILKSYKLLVPEKLKNRIHIVSEMYQKAYGLIIMSLTSLRQLKNAQLARKATPVHRNSSVYLMCINMDPGIPLEQIYFTTKSKIM